MLSAKRAPVAGECGQGGQLRLVETANQRLQRFGLMIRSAPAASASAANGVPRNASRAINAGLRAGQFCN